MIAIFHKYGCRLLTNDGETHEDISGLISSYMVARLIEAGTNVQESKTSNGDRRVDFTHELDRLLK